jgi:multisubunit Na+/H+ antiporter MnhB subunit
VSRIRRAIADREIDLVEPSAVVIFYAVMVASVYLVFAGHNHPGGGFVGGLVAGGGIAVRYVVGGIDDVRHLARFRPWTILGTGVLTAAATAVVPIMFGRAALESGSWELDLPVFRHVKVSTVTVFDLGVYVAVIGLVLMVFEAFGDEYMPDPPATTSAPSRPERS